MRTQDRTAYHMSDDFCTIFGRFLDACLPNVAAENPVTAPAILQLPAVRPKAVPATDEVRTEPVRAPVVPTTLIIMGPTVPAAAAHPAAAVPKLATDKTEAIG